METDAFGNPCCGQDFMAGTICTLPPGHAGGHEATCQNCGNDWINQECTCFQTCRYCGSYVYDAQQADICEDCEDHHYDELVAQGIIKPLADPWGPTPEELAETYRSLGVEPPTQ